MSIVVEISDDEIEYLRSVAKLRNDPKHIKSQATEDCHLEGLVGEWAVAQFFGYDLDTECYGLNGDGGVDFETPYGSIDVKTVNFKNPTILKVYEDMSDFKADIVVLVYRESNKKVFIKGWITRKDFINKSYLSNKFSAKRKSGPRWCLNEDQFNPIMSLRK